jgi:hypothetical protein
VEPAVVEFLVRQHHGRAAMRALHPLRGELPGLVEQALTGRADDFHDAFRSAGPLRNQPLATDSGTSILSFGIGMSSETA